VVSSQTRPTHGMISRRDILRRHGSCLVGLRQDQSLARVELPSTTCGVKIKSARKPRTLAIRAPASRRSHPAKPQTILGLRWATPHKLLPQPPGQMEHLGTRQMEVTIPTVQEPQPTIGAIEEEEKEEKEAAFISLTSGSFSSVHSSCTMHLDS